MLQLQSGEPTKAIHLDAAAAANDTANASALAMLRRECPWAKTCTTDSDKPGMCNSDGKCVTECSLMLPCWCDAPMFGMASACTTMLSEPGTCTMTKPYECKPATTTTTTTFAYNAYLDDDSYGDASGDDVPGDDGFTHANEYKNEDSFFPFLYVIFGPDGPLARLIVRPNEDCPQIWIDGWSTGMSPPPVNLRGTGNAEGIYDFPVRVCEASLPRNASGGHWGGRRLPPITPNPQKYVLLGDTGLRVKPTNLGTCKTKKPDGKKVYGVAQCKEDDIVLFNPDLVAGAYQNLSNWPLEPLMEQAALTKPDVVIHVGDFLYRQGPCAENKGCAGINSKKAYGDNWRGWSQDFFLPARSLLEAAPWIVVRGNHENCARGGHGWFLFLDPRPLPYSTREYTAPAPGLYCADYTDAYAVSFENEQFIVMDDSAVSPMNGGIDHMDFTHGCPGGKAVSAQETNRHWDPNQSEGDIQKQVEYFTEQFEKVRDLAERKTTNIYVSHRPLNGVACNGTHYVTLDWTMQQASSLAEGSLDKVTLAIGGHMHWFEGLDFEGRGHPAQLVVGNGGTKLIPNKVAQDELSDGKLEVVGHKVSKGITSSHFGYVTMTSSPDEPFKATALQLGDSALQGQSGGDPYWELSVARGPRSKSLFQNVGPVRTFGKPLI